jgi:hypothetical protein
MIAEDRQPSQRGRNMVRSIGVSAIAVLATVLGTATAASAAVGQPAGASGSSRASLPASLPAAGARPGSFASLHGVITRITVGRSARFTYTVANLASGQTAQLQRTFGTAKAWREVAHLAAKRNAPLTAPALGTLGKYAYRVAIVRAGKLVKSSPSVMVYAYGNVPLAPFCGGGCTGTEQVGNTVFSYTDETGADYYPSYSQNQAFTATSCRSLTVRYAGTSNVQADNATSYLEFVQSSVDPVYSSTPAGAIGSVTVALDSGPVYIDTATGDGAPISFNMTGSCYTVSGTP